MTRAPTRITAAWRPVGALMAITLGAGGCGGGLQGFGGPPTPLVTFRVLVSGDLAPLLPPGDPGPRSLQVALVWGEQWLTEPLCVLPPENDDVARVIDAGCRDSFAFVPARVAGSVPVQVGVPASLSLLDLPGADVMVGDITSRVAYGSMVVYDDRDGDGTLGLAIPRRLPGGGPGPPMQNVDDTPDVVYGASFVTMTAPDQRVAFLEGKFTLSGFYPRSGCAAPEPGFRVLGAGGFSAADGLTAAVTGRLPPEDPASCTMSRPEETTIDIGLQAPGDVQEVSCVQRRDDSSVRYREPPPDPPDFSGRVMVCAHLPSFDDGVQSSLIQLVVSGRARDRCKGLTHYTLRGCRENVACPVPDWDFTATPPAWWPCPQ